MCRETNKKNKSEILEYLRNQGPRLQHIVMCIGPNQKNQPNLDLYLYLRYIFSQLLLMVSVSKYLKDTEDTPLMYLYLVWRYKIFVSVATLAD